MNGEVSLDSLDPAPLMTAYSEARFLPLRPNPPTADSLPLFSFLSTGHRETINDNLIENGLDAIGNLFRLIYGRHRC
jgi:hypothetical protein